MTALDVLVSELSCHVTLKQLQTILAESLRKLGLLLKGRVWLRNLNTWTVSVLLLHLFCRKELFSFEA